MCLTFLPFSFAIALTAKAGIAYVFPAIGAGEDMDDVACAPEFRMRPALVGIMQALGDRGLIHASA